MTTCCDVLFHSLNYHAPLPEVTGLRLQPLVSLLDGRTRGYEVLTRLSEDIDPGAFFASLEPQACLSLFEWQIDVTCSLELPAFLSMNLPVAVLADTAAVHRLCAHTPPRRLVIELQDPASLRTLSNEASQALAVGIINLQMAGWPVWLDDLTTDLVQDVLALGIRFDGVKIDRSEIRRRQSEADNLRALVSQARRIGGLILVEGIETVDALMHAGLSGASLGQGFLWPECELALSGESMQRGG